MAKRTTASLAEPSGDRRFAAVVRAFADDQAVTRATMFGSEGLKIDGKVFAMVVKGRLVVKLPRSRVEALIASGEGTSFDPGHGRVMKEWIAIPPGPNWRAFAADARTFVGRAQQ